MADQIPFQEAIDFLHGKVNLPTKKYDGRSAAGSGAAFTVAGVTRDDMLSDFRAAIEKARIEGTGFNEFRKDFDAIVDRTGWAFNARGETDEERRDWRARIIYKTNMRTSYMAGRWAQLTDPTFCATVRICNMFILAPSIRACSTSPGTVLSFGPPIRPGRSCIRRTAGDVTATSRRCRVAIWARLGKDGPDPAPNLDPYESFDRRTGRRSCAIPASIAAGITMSARNGWAASCRRSCAHRCRRLVSRQSRSTCRQCPSR